MNLPDGWALAQLPQLIGPGGVFTDGDWVESKDQDPNGDVRLIQLADIGDGYYKNKSRRFLTHQKALELCCTFLEPGDVLVARLPDPLGRACIFPGDAKPAVTAVDICIIRPGLSGPESRWIMHVLNSPSVRQVIEGLHRGTTRKRVSRRNLASVKLPLAPLSEQRRIVATIEELLARVNATRERLAKVPNILKRFRQAVLAAACSGRLTEDWRKGRDLMHGAPSLLERISSTKSEPNVANEETSIEMPEIPENWAWYHCEQLCDPKRSITYGVIKLGPPVSDGVPTLRSSDVRWLYIDDTDIKRISPKVAANYSRTFLKGGEVLVTVRGTLGGVAVVPPTMAGFNISREVAMLPVLSQLKSAFIAYAIASPWCQNWLSEVTKGVAYSG